MRLETAETIFKYITDDFESAWEALVARPGKHEGGGNFLFALLAMILLEFACRVCKQGDKKQRLNSLSTKLSNIEPKYFTKVPYEYKPRKPEFCLPGGASTLLALLFDIIRNGKAHQ